MMSTQPALKASVILTADSPKGRQATDLFRDAYDHVGLDDKRGQFLNENKAFPAALRRLIEEHSMPVMAPEGGRIHILRVPVNPAREWQEAINAAGPNTPRNYDIRKVGNLHPPQSGEPKEKEIILVNFGKTIPNSQFALDWANPYSLRPASPRECFAIGEHKPQLHRELDMNPMAVVSLEDCVFGGLWRVCCVWWGGSERVAGLSWFAYGWHGSYWFAFVRE